MPNISRRILLQQTPIGCVAAVQVASAAPAAHARGAGIGFPREFSGRNLDMLALPLCGVGAVSISLGGRGQLRRWECFNKADKGNSPGAV